MWRSACALTFAIFAAGCTNFSLLDSGSDPEEAHKNVSESKELEKEFLSAKERNARLEGQIAESLRKVETLTREIRDLQKKETAMEGAMERLSRENVMKKIFPTTPSRQKRMWSPRRPSSHIPSPRKGDATANKQRVASTTPQDLYNKSYRAVRDGKSGEAIRGFRLFLRLFPNSQLAGHSQYWLGEAYYALKQYPEALVEFQNLITNYPGSRKVPDAYYKRGLTYVRRGFPLIATLEFEKLLEKYPSHPLSKKAKVQLQNLEHYTGKKLR